MAESWITTASPLEIRALASLSMKTFFEEVEKLPFTDQCLTVKTLLLASGVSGKLLNAPEMSRWLGNNHEAIREWVSKQYEKEEAKP